MFVKKEYTDVSTLEEGDQISLGTINLSTNEIISFATDYDPLDFHLSEEGGKKSVFGGLIASGPHIFNKFHKEKWIPLFGKTVICGMEVNRWKFLQPVRPDEEISCTATVMRKDISKTTRNAIITWVYDFRRGETAVQYLEMTIMHKMA